MAMIPIQASFAAFRGPVDRTVYEPGFTLWRRTTRALRRIVQAIVTLPDRGGTAMPSDVPPEYFRFPPF
jgi:hypothetical protein